MNNRLEGLGMTLASSLFGAGNLQEQAAANARQSQQLNAMAGLSPPPMKPRAYAHQPP